MAWFKRKRPPTPEELLAAGRAESAAAARSAGIAPAPADAVADPVEPAAPSASAFRLTIEDVFTITGRGTVATGRVATGSVAVGQRVRLLRDGTEVATLDVAAVEMFRRKLDSAVAGENVGLLLRGVDRTQLGRGDVLSG